MDRGESHVPMTTRTASAVPRTCVERVSIVAEAERQWTYRRYNTEQVVQA